MNVEVAIAVLNPVFKEWQSISTKPEKAKYSVNNYFKKLRAGQDTQNFDITQRIAFLLVEELQKSNSGQGADELESKYNELIKAKNLLENKLIDYKTEIKEKESNMKDTENRCKIDVKNTNQDNKILKQKNDNIKKWWVNELGGDIDILLKAMNKGFIMDLEFESDNDDYCPYSDEDQDPE
tara:strand:+ start:361 stop:903 length:543 start_codon:yes stop_codon:yes gene_type:complete